MTSWTDDQLEQLANISNHKMVEDAGGEYRWMHNINGKWEVHSIKVFEDINTPYSWLYFWVDKWDEELKNRREKAFRSKNRKLRAIKRNSRLDNKTKVLRLRTLMPEYTQQDIANALSISLSTVKRYLRS
jgi:hypothetical protein